MVARGAVIQSDFIGSLWNVSHTTVSLGFFGLGQAAGFPIMRSFISTLANLAVVIAIATCENC
mgnify:CR=1 FL=1